MTQVTSLPVTHRDALPRAPRPLAGNIFAIVGGPGAWFIQLCLGDLMASGGCYRGSSRFLGAASSQAWTWPAMIALLIVCAAIALAAFLVSFRRLRQTSGAGTPHDAPVPARTGGAAHFLALWGTFLGAGFCLATLLTVVAYLAVPRCT